MTIQETHERTGRFPEGEYVVKVIDSMYAENHKGTHGFRTIFEGEDGAMKGEIFDYWLWTSSPALKYTIPWINSVGVGRLSDLRDGILCGMRLRVRLRYAPCSTGVGPAYLKVDVLEVL